MGCEMHRRQRDRWKRGPWRRFWNSDPSHLYYFLAAMRCQAFFGMHSHHGTHATKGPNPAKQKFLFSFFLCRLFQMFCQKMERWSFMHVNQYFVGVNNKTNCWIYNIIFIFIHTHTHILLNNPKYHLRFSQMVQDFKTLSSEEVSVRGRQWAATVISRCGEMGWITGLLSKEACQNTSRGTVTSTKKILKCIIIEGKHKNCTQTCQSALWCFADVFPCSAHTISW